MKLLNDRSAVCQRILPLLALSTLGVFPPAVQAQTPEVSQAVQHAVSVPVRDLPNVREPRALHVIPVRPLPVGPTTGAPDTALQTSVGPLVSSTPGLNIAGVGNGDYGFAPDAAPPDTNGAVGTTQYVQWVNESFAVFSKTGTLLAGPKAGNTLWSTLGGGCATNNDGDPIVQFDKQAGRWIFTQFSVSSSPFLQCVAVSQTSDATGAYNLYSFSYGTNFPDYPKLGVWPDAYYITFNIFANGSTRPCSQA